MQNGQECQGDSVPFPGEEEDVCLQLLLLCERGCRQGSRPPAAAVAAPAFPSVCLRLCPFPVETEDMGRRKDIFGNVSLQSVFFTRLPQLQNVKGKKKNLGTNSRQTLLPTNLSK